MIVNDLAALEQAPDIVIVGAGLSGLVLANSLVTHGFNVLVIEAGGETPIAGLDPLNTVRHARQEYLGAAEGRARGLGGTSTKWGGAMLPILPYDLCKHPLDWHTGFGIQSESLDMYLPELEELFNIPHDSYEEDTPAVQVPLFLARRPKWPAFKNRSTANLFARQIKTEPKLKIALGALATSINVKNGHVESLEVVTSTAERVVLETNALVLTAGAIETTRLLSRVNGRESSVTAQSSKLGACFHDHISAPIASLKVKDSRALNRIFGFQFNSGSMRNLRYELSPEEREKSKLPAAFFHVAFTRDPDGAFERLRSAFQTIQRGKLPSLKQLIGIASGGPWLIKAVFVRFFSKKLLPPPGCVFEIHLVTEQEPNEENRITIRHDEDEPANLPETVIEWSISRADMDFFHEISQKVVSSWESSFLAEIADVSSYSKDSIESQILRAGEIFHPAGTTRIGANPSESVVDTNLKVHGVGGIWVASTSVFPSIGGSSPSLGLLQLTLRLRDHIVSTVRAATRTVSS